MLTSSPGKYHQEVSEYYDTDARLGFEDRAGSNPMLDRIRSDFRKITVAYEFNDALEIGCGPGFDVQWFASRFPEKNITGIDISAEMVNLAKKRITDAGLKNARILQGDDRNMEELFFPGSFDLIYVYFGALNTVADLDKSAEIITRLLRPGGHAVLTFVNKWYLREMLVQAAKFRLDTAFSRLKKVWGGYSPDRFLPSKCYAPSRIRRAFRHLNLIERKGYSIVFPAWYNFPKYRNKAEKADKLWSIDQKLQRSLLWSTGEYTLFVFKKEE